LFDLWRQYQIATTWEEPRKDQRLQSADIVRHIDDATQGALNVPEFQRRYVWRPSKVAALVDSLWRGYPVGTLLLWESAYDSPRTALGGQGKKLWIVDGQQRVTSLSILFGKKPYWWDDAREWNKYYEKYDVLANITKGKDDIEFGLPNPVRRKSENWISVRSVLTSPSLSELAMQLCEKLGDTKQFAHVHEKLQSIKKMETAQLYEIIVDHELEDVAEIFARLNTAGTKIRESDIVVALVAAKQQGWIRQKFDPFLKDLENIGFEFDPSVVVRTLAIVGNGNARLRDVPEAFWGPSDEFDEHWRNTKDAITAVIRNMMSYGVLSSDLLPSMNVLIPVFVLRATFPTEFKFERAFRWSGTTALDQDSRQIRNARTFNEAITRLSDSLSAQTSFAADDFMDSYTDKFMRLVLYLVAFDNHSMDWMNQDVRIGFDRVDNELNEGFKPEWHHVFPRKVLRGRVDDTMIDVIANIVVLNEKANRSFNAKSPEQYIRDHNVHADRLREQAVAPVEQLVLDRYEEVLRARAGKLAESATKFLQKLAEV
jgi:hypothetical protein